MVRLVAVFLVHNEDLHVEHAIRNVASACDRIHVVDHLSTDRTPEILRSLEAELDHMSVVRSGDAGDSQRVIEEYAGTDTWVLGVDGDELFDPTGLQRLRAELEDGQHADVFRLKAHVLNCVELDEQQGRARGHMAPPSRPVTKMFNFAAITSWTDCLERLHDGNAVFRSPFGWDSMRYLSETTAWETDPLRMLHMCFVRRSTKDVHDRPRKGLPETGAWRRGPTGLFDRIRRRRHLDPRIKEYNRSGGSWKQEWYARGPEVTVDARPFLLQPTISRQPTRETS